MTEVVTCNGAQEGFYQIMTAHVKVGDEVVAIEPCFDAPWKIAAQLGACDGDLSNDCIPMLA
jgi:aspartate/methionine/tyrosine aminotransferase